MHNQYRWPIYAYETLSSVIPRLCVKGDPYTIVANVLFHCSDAIIGNNVNYNVIDSISNTFRNEYYKSLCYVYSNWHESRNTCLEYAFSPLNVSIVQKVSPRIRNLSLKLLKSLLHQSISDFGYLNTSFKERIDVNGLLKSVGAEDFLDAVGLLRLSHKLKFLTGRSIDTLLDFHMASGQDGRVRSIGFIKELVDSETNLDTLINCSNWSLKRVLDNIAGSECLVSFELFSASLKYNKLLSQVRRYLESVDESTGLLKCNWGYRMRHHLPNKLHFPEPVEVVPKSLVEDLTSRVNAKGSVLQWDSDTGSFVIKLNNDTISIVNRHYTFVDSIAGLDKLFEILNSCLDKNMKKERKISINVEYTAKGAPSLLALSINLDYNGVKTWLVDLMNSDSVYTETIFKLIEWILSCPGLAKLGHRIECYIELLSIRGHYINDIVNLSDITAPRVQVDVDGNIQNNDWIYSTYSLNSLISSLLGINLPRISNWDIRPIPIMNLQYAALRSCSILELDDLLLKNHWKPTSM